MKKIKTIIRGFIWLFGGIYLAIVVMLHIPFIQRELGKSVAQLLSQTLDTEVTVGRIDLGILNTIIIDDIAISDQQKQPLINISRMAAKVDIIDLIQAQKIRISSAQLFGLKANFYKKRIGATPNYQFLIDALSSNDRETQQPLDLSIHSLIIRNSSIAYRQLDKPWRKHVFSPYHLQISKLSAHINIDHLTDNEIDCGVRYLSLEEASGFQLKKLSFALIANKKRAEIQDFRIELPHSSIAFPLLTARYQWREGKPALRGTEVEVELPKSFVSFADLRPFLGKMGDINERLSVSGGFHLSQNTLRVKNLKVSTDSPRFGLHLDGRITQIFQRPSLAFPVAQIHVAGSLLHQINDSYQLKLPQALLALGNVQYRGTCLLHRGGQRIKGQLSTDVGNARLALNIDNRQISGEVETTAFRLDNVLKQSGLSDVALHAQFRANRNLTTLAAKGNIPRLTYNGYTYYNISLDATYENNRAKGFLALNDPNGNLRIEGTAENIIGFMRKRNAITADVQLDVKNFNPAALRLTNQLGNTAFSFQTTLKGSFTSPEKLLAAIEVNNLLITNKKETFNLPHISVKADHHSLSKNIAIASSFGNIRLNGNYDYPTLHASAMNTLRHYLPALSAQHATSIGTRTQHRFHIEADLSDDQWLRRFLKTDISFTDLSLQADIDEAQKQIHLQLASPQITIAKQNFQNLDVQLSTPQKKLLIDLFTQRIDPMGRTITLHTSGEAANNLLSTATAFRLSGETTIRGDVKCATQFERRDRNLATAIRFQPSEIQIDTIRLQIQPSEITYAGRNLVINHFEVSNKQQHISINGETTGNENDSILVQLKDIDVPYILKLVNFRSVAFDGVASGKVVVKSIFKNLQAAADLTVEDFTFQDGHIGTLFANASYTQNEGKIHIDAIAEEGEEAQTKVEGYVDLKNSYIHLPIFAYNTRLEFLKSFCGAFMDNIQLRGYGWCKVVGTLKDVNLEGDMEASGSVRMKSLGTTYALRQARIRLIPNEIIFERDTITDAFGNIGIVTGGLHHQALRNLGYDIQINAQKLLAYDFPKRRSTESFWGRIFGTGMCRILGRPGETTINIDMRPEKNSFITYNTTDNSVGENAFIRWRDVTPVDSAASQTDTTSQNWRKRKISSTEEDDFASDLRINLLANATPDFTLNILMDETTGDNIALNGEGGIKATYYNKGGLQLYGNYNVMRGTYNFTIQNVIKKQFSFQQGSTIAFGGDPFSAVLNLKGVYALNSVPLSDLGLGRSFRTSNTKVNCLLNIDGTAMNPRVTFGLSLPMLSADALKMVHAVLNSEQDLNQQVLYLLAVGRFYPQGANNASGSAAQPGQASLAMQSILSGTLSQQINNVLSNVVNNSNWNFGANIATGDEGFSNAEYEGILSGRLLNNRLLINGEFGYRDNVATNTSAFIGDFDVKYLLFPSGNLAINFYSKTNDRYFTRNSLTTQGLGLIIKKDFHTLSDLFGIRKKKKKKK